MEHSKKQFKYETYKELYNLISETLNIGFMLTDFEYNVLEVNKRLLNMLGLTAGQKKNLVGHSIKEFFQNEQDFNNWKKELVNYDTGFNYSFEDNLKTLGGSDRAIRVYVNRLNDVKRDGFQDGIATVLINDIEEQKRTLEGLEAANIELIKSRSDIEHKNKILETVLFGIDDCVTIFDPHENILLSSLRGNKIRGSRNKPLLPMESGKESDVKIAIDGREHYFTGKMQGIYDSQKGEIFAYVETLKDITNQIELDNRTEELKRIKQKLNHRNIQTNLIGYSKAMDNVLQSIDRCASVSSPILLLGETGVGKEVVARAIHENSDRRERPFIAVNCGALPDSLIESELFGHVKGAFTGANTDRNGLFREAHGGTLFLDEIGDIKLQLQVKMLRALQEGMIRPVGDSIAYPVDVRIISATNLDLKTLVEQKRFRHDLYYRLAVIPILIPPLRDRKEDILPLINHFIQKQAKENRVRAKKPDAAAHKYLYNYSWPGNIRELENAIEYALAMSITERLTIEDFPMLNLTNSTSPMHTTDKPEISTETPDVQPPTSLKLLEEKKLEKERERIFKALLLHDGNRTLAAKELGISKTTLWRKINKTKLSE